jgi:hypothetical protein
MRFGSVRVKPTLLLSYVDGDAAFLDTATPVRDHYLQIEPTIALGAGTPGTATSQFTLTYGPRFRVGAAVEELRTPSHFATATLDVPLGIMFALHARHHFAHGVLETAEADPGREFFFRLSPFTRQETHAELAVNPQGVLGLEVGAGRDSVRIDEGSGFFTHRTDSLLSSVDYHFGVASRVFVRYEWDHVPAPLERPIVESTGSTVSVGVAGDLLPLLRGDLLAGFRSLDAPRAGSGGTRYRGSVLSATLRKEFTPSASLGLLGRRETYPSGFEENAFYVVTGVGAETDLAFPLSLVFHGAVGWQRNGYEVVATGLAVPRQDTIVSWSAGVGRAVTRWSFLRVDYRDDRRHSNVPGFATHGHVLVFQLGLGPAPGVGR